MLGLYYHFFQSLEHELALDYSALFWASIRVERKGQTGLNDVFLGLQALARFPMGLIYALWSLSRA